MTNAIVKVDEVAQKVVASWNIYSTALATSIAVVAGYKLLCSQEPDIHPLLLARQAAESELRREGESATFRSLQTPHGYALKTGLGISDPETPKWTPGRDGDLRDIWRAVLRGAVDPKTGKVLNVSSKFHVVRGRSIQAHQAHEVTREINLIGRKIQKLKGEYVAVCLCNSIELLAIIFASAFYGFKVLLIPPGASPQLLHDILRRESVDTYVAEAGSFSVIELLESSSQIKNLISVTRGGSSHMGWDLSPDVAHEMHMSTWRDLDKDIELSMDDQLPSTENAPPAPPLAALWETPSDYPYSNYRITYYEQSNIVAGVASTLAAFTHRHRLTHSDVVLSTAPLTSPYPLSVILAAIFMNASVILDNIAGHDVDLAIATRACSPTVVVATSTAVSRFHSDYLAPRLTPFVKFGRFFQQRSLNHGVFPSSPNILSSLPDAGFPESARLLLIAHNHEPSHLKGKDVSQSRLTPQQLSDLRILLYTRVAYALTNPGVFGAVTQTNPDDYRLKGTRFADFGAPVCSLEIKLLQDEKDSVDQEDGRIVKGSIIASGPSVVADARMGRDWVPGQINDDYTLSLA